jgi:hypothetical protein
MRLLVFWEGIEPATLCSSESRRALDRNHRAAGIDILYTLDSASLLVKLKPRIFQRLPPFE